MSSRSIRAAALFAVVTSSSFARAAGNDAAAKKLDEQAMGDDYLATQFTRAEKKLKKAISLCDKGRCAPSLLAKLYRDLFVIYYAGLDKKDEAKEALAKAFEIDPDVELDKDLTTREMAKVFDSLSPKKNKTKKKPPEPKEDSDDEPEPPPRAEKHDEDKHDEEHETPREAPPSPPRVRSNWASLVIEQDAAMIFSNTADVCTADQQVNGPYSCFRATGSQYHGTPVIGRGDTIGTGLALATTRILLGYDRVITGGFTLGWRLGVVVHGGGPRPEGEDAHPFIPFHLEARAAYFFGDDVFAAPGFRPFLFASLGVGQIDSHFTTDVKEDTSRPPPPNQADNPARQTLDVYRHMGRGFGGGGVGLFYEITPGAGLLLDVKAMGFFPTLGTAIAPELGGMIGF